MCVATQHVARRRSGGQSIGDLLLGKRPGAAGAGDRGVAGLGGSLGVWVSGHMPRRTPNNGPAGGRALIASASREHSTYQVQLSGAYSAPSPRLRHGRRDTADVCRLSRGLGALKEKAVAPRAAHTAPPRGSAPEGDGTAADWRRQETCPPATESVYAHSGKIRRTYVGVSD